MLEGTPHMPFPILEKKEELDALPEGIKSEYEEKDGKWHPKVPDVTKLQQAIDAERTKAEDERKARNKAERERDELKRKQAAADSGISEEKLEELRKADAEARKPLETKVEELSRELTKVKKTDRVQSLALKYGVLPDRIEDAMLALEKRTGLTEDGDTITVLDKAGKLTTETVDDFLKVSFKKEKPWLYKGSGASGSGASQSAGEDPEPVTPAAAQEKSLAAKRAVVATAL
jgi:dsDNA-specific endonuclease/ATPase MutS2